MKLNLSRASEARFGQDFEFYADVWLRSRDFEDDFDQDLCLTCDMNSRSYFGKMNSTLGSVVPLAMFHGRY